MPSFLHRLCPERLPGWLCSAFFGILLSTTGHAAIPLDGAGTLAVYGDGRLRFEKDWDSYRGDGTQRSDRSRLRIRGRLGLSWKPADFFEANVRVRTGNDDHQQSGHITIADFNGNANGSSDLNLDKWYGQFNWRGLSVWGGRNSLPWWKQNSLFWDDDVTPRGVGLIFRSDLGPGTFTLNSGVYDMPAGMRHYTGDAWSTQLVYAQDSDHLGLTVAGGLMSIDADAETGDYATRTLLQGNALRDYENWTLTTQLRFNNLPRPFHLGADFYHNAEDYSASDPNVFTAFHADDTDGYVVQAVYGGVKEQWDWLAGAYYAHIEALALHNSYAQDDWVRWGNSDQSTSSNFKGPEFRAGLGLGHNANLIARLFIVRAINQDLPTDIRKQTAKRFRVDLNIKF
jgi:hypothetical protein